ncbi:CDP-glucose 4,6-dehydratase [Halopseudomonas salina]|uniref:CDP-glucose 4,6-dehydratase n=1 Tax=Halopseudomonas salina TaxID=1323744 RepID=A0ABQ1PLT6_9GAMM|nr:CDP-glucose 4,6-dehydratase [Halopseudomonas salina]GGC99321.1 CDP-glucose 4,6-dehydratase [Halopseudomonas salina]
MGVNTDFWTDRRVLLTGHTGFKGSWLAIWLRSLGAEVYGIALAPENEPSLWSTAGLASCVDGSFTDIRDQSALTDKVLAFAPEIVFHLAAQPLVRASYRDPVETYSTNVMGTVHLLEALRQTESVKAIVVVTTDKCYENQEWQWPYRETDRLGGFDPYSNSKACAELVCASYRDAFFTPAGVALATARAGNVIGGGDWGAERLLPDVLRAWDAGEELTLRYPGATRPWQHVLEPLSGYLKLAEYLLAVGTSGPSAWNFGPDNDSVVSVESVVARMAALWTYDQARWRCVEASQPHEAGVLALDSSRARSQLAWRPHWTLDMALQRTLDWHSAWRKGDDLQALCLQQIALHQGESV